MAEKSDTRLGVEAAFFKWLKECDYGWHGGGLRPLLARAMEQAVGDWLKANSERLIAAIAQEVAAGGALRAKAPVEGAPEIEAEAAAAAEAEVPDEEADDGTPGRSLE